MILFLKMHIQIYKCWNVTRCVCTVILNHQYVHTRSTTWLMNIPVSKIDSKMGWDGKLEKIEIED